MVCDDVAVQGPHGDARIVSVTLPEADADVVRIVQGFTYDVGDDAIIKTIGRSGSDIMAAAVAKHVHAHEVVIYTDVYGVFSADPLGGIGRLLRRDARPRRHRTGVCGRNVLHPRTVQFLLGTGIDLIVRHVEKSAGGTLVNERTTNDMPLPRRRSERGPSLAHHGGHGHARRPGIVANLFASLANAGANVSFITQSCSETCVTFAVDRKDVDKCAHLMGKVSDVRPVAIVSLVGGSMRASVGVAGKFFQALFDGQRERSGHWTGRHGTEHQRGRGRGGRGHCHGGGERLCCARL